VLVSGEPAGPAAAHRNGCLHAIPQARSRSRCSDRAERSTVAPNSRTMGERPLAPVLCAGKGEGILLPAGTLIVSQGKLPRRLLLPNQPLGPPNSGLVLSLLGEHAYVDERGKRHAGNSGRWRAGVNRRLTVFARSDQF